MSESLSNFDVVALLADLSEHKLVKGQVGLVVETLSPEQVEVEFVDEQGKTYAVVSIPIKQLMRLHYHRFERALPFEEREQAMNSLVKQAQSLGMGY